MTERLIEKIDRLANAAGIKEVTPEIRRFAMLVREDVVAQWPQREWVGLTEQEETGILLSSKTVYSAMKFTEAKLKEKNT
jgi:hypothetical protein